MGTTCGAWLVGWSSWWGSGPPTTQWNCLAGEWIATGDTPCPRTRKYSYQIRSDGRIPRKTLPAPTAETEPGPPEEQTRGNQWTWDELPDGELRGREREATGRSRVDYQTLQGQISTLTRSEGLGFVMTIKKSIQNSVHLNHRKYHLPPLEEESISAARKLRLQLGSLEGLRLGTEPIRAARLGTRGGKPRWLGQDLGQDLVLIQQSDI